MAPRRPRTSREGGGRFTCWGPASPASVSSAPVVGRKPKMGPLSTPPPSGLRNRQRKAGCGAPRGGKAGGPRRGVGSLAEGRQPADAMPEGGRLPLGLCQRRDPLLGRAGGQGRVLPACQVVGPAEGWAGDESRGRRCVGSRAAQGRACGVGRAVPRLPQTPTLAPLGPTAPKGLGCPPWSAGGTARGHGEA